MLPFIHLSAETLFLTVLLTILEIATPVRTLGVPPILRPKALLAAAELMGDGNLKEVLRTGDGGRGGMACDGRVKKKKRPNLQEHTLVRYDSYVETAGTVEVETRVRASFCRSRQHMWGTRRTLYVLPQKLLIKSWRQLQYYQRSNKTAQNGCFLEQWSSEWNWEAFTRASSQGMDTQVLSTSICLGLEYLYIADQWSAGRFNQNVEASCST